MILLSQPRPLSLPGELGLFQPIHIRTILRLRLGELLSLQIKRVSSNRYVEMSALSPFPVYRSNLAQVQYHLYAPIGPHNQNTLGYQRNVHDLFLPNDFREELQKKAAATLQTLPSMLKLDIHIYPGQRLTKRIQIHNFPLRSIIFTL